MHNGMPYYSNGTYFVWYEGFEWAWFINQTVGSGAPLRFIWALKLVRSVRIVSGPTTIPRVLSISSISFVPVDDFYCWKP
jgi:hypothetical protein